MIVEGDCEYDCYPSFISKITDYPTYVPMLNCGGIGSLIVNLEEHLLDIVRGFAPETIIITVDLKDAIDQKFVSDCSQLKELLHRKSLEWLERSKTTKIKKDLPKNISIVIVDKTYETWLIADMVGLASCDLIVSDKLDETFENVDTEITSPSGWLKSKLCENIDPKSKRYRKQIGKCINPIRGEHFSRSLKKFCKEVRIALAI